MNSKPWWTTASVPPQLLWVPTVSAAVFGSTALPARAAR